MWQFLTYTLCCLTGLASSLQPLHVGRLVLCDGCQRILTGEVCVIIFLECSFRKREGRTDGHMLVNHILNAQKGLRQS